MQWEDLYLAPALEDADAWGPERKALLARDHLEQRAELATLVVRLEDPGERAGPLAESVLDWIQRLHRDMEEEEAGFLSESILRDDVVGIDVEGG